jgi:hypothetical protein
MGRLIDLTGRSYGRLIVIERHAQNGPQQQPRWICECVCGSTTVVYGNLLRTGQTESCGCKYRGPTATRPSAPYQTHGQSRRTTEYTCWINMKERCYNVNHRAYKNYGGRGITVDPRWARSFETFFSEVGPRPAGLTLDRIDNSRGYWPGNVRWATYSEQALNRRGPCRREQQVAE